MTKVEITQKGHSSKYWKFLTRRPFHTTQVCVVWHTNPMRFWQSQNILISKLQPHHSQKMQKCQIQQKMLLPKGLECFSWKTSVNISTLKSVWMNVPPIDDVLVLLQVLFKLFKAIKIDIWQLVYNTTTTTVVF